MSGNVMTTPHSTKMPKRPHEILTLICSAVALFVVAVSILVFAAYQTRSQYEQRAAFTVENIVNLLAQNISSEFTKSDVLLQAVVQEMEGRLARGSVDRDEINDTIAHLAALNPELLAVRVVDTQGVVRFGVDQSGQRISASSAVNVSDRDYFQQARQQTKAELIYTPPFIGRVVAKPVIQLVRRISGPDGAFAGVAYLAFDIHTLSTLIQNVNLGPHGMSVLRMKDHTVVARFSPSSPEYELIGKQAVSAQFKEIVARQPDFGSYWGVTPSDHVLRLFAYRRINNYPGYISAGIARDDITFDWWGDVLTLALLLPIFLVAVAIGARTIRVIRRRLEREYVGNALLAAIVDSSNDAIIGEDLDGVITSWNTAAEEMFGYGPKEAIGRKLADLIVPESGRGEEAEILARLGRGEKIPNIDSQRQRKDGALLEVSLTASPLRDAEGKIIGGSKTVRDITRQKQAESQILELNASLERQVAERTADFVAARDDATRKAERLATMNRELQRLAMVSAHHFQEPLRPIVSYAQLIAARNAGRDPDLDRDLNFIRSGGLHLKALLRDFQSYVDALTRVPAIDEVPLAEIVAAAMTRVTKKHGRNAATLEIGDFPVLRGDRVMLTEVFSQLFTNSVVHFGGQLPTRIRVSVAASGEEWLVSVDDDGPGFGGGTDRRLFQVFENAHGRDPDSTGFGLPFSRVVVEAHGGRIWVDRPGQAGASIRFTLPRDPEAFL